MIEIQAREYKMTLRSYRTLQSLDMKHSADNPVFAMPPKNTSWMFYSVLLTILRFEPNTAAAR